MWNYLAKLFENDSILFLFVQLIFIIELMMDSVVTVIDTSIIR